MPSVKRPDKSVICVELPKDLDHEFRLFCEGFPLGTLTQHVQLAIRRYLAAPPRVELPPLPELPMPHSERHNRLTRVTD